MSIDMLRALAEGRIHHLNNGLCPDVVSGHESRDPDCVVCQALSSDDTAPEVMSNLREAAQSVIDAWDWGVREDVFEARMSDLKTMLAQPDDKAQPVAYRYKVLNPFGSKVWTFDLTGYATVLETQPLYATPQTPSRITLEHPIKPEWMGYKQSFADGKSEADMAQPPTASPTRRVAMLSDERIEKVARSHGTGGWQTLDDMCRFARAVIAADRAARGGASSTPLLDQIRRQRVRGQEGAA